MNIPLSWLKDFIDIDLPLDELAKVMTMCGLEVDEVHLVGLPKPENEQSGFKFTGLSWPKDKFVVAEVLEVNKHPEADRLTLCQLDDGTGERTILTGAPNLYPYIGKGRLEKPVKVAYVREGAVLYDGHKPGWELAKLKKTKIRGFETNSMVCSAKEIGLSDEHDGIIIFDDDAPVGMPLVDYIGDAVYVIDILPNMARNACIRGVALEIAAQLNIPMKQPVISVKPEGKSVKGMAKIEIKDSELNPRFLVGFAEGVKAQPSPEWVQRRLALAGMRSINSVVDATNYVMLEVGQPLHSFDYDTLLKRADGKTPTIITRRANKGEKLLTLDNIERNLDENMELVTDEKGALSIAGVMGGMESEVTSETTNVLIESANWNFINIRKTVSKLKLTSEAGYRNSRGIHPAVCQEACELCLERMVEWSGGRVAPDFIDNYARPYKDPTVQITSKDIRQVLGIDLTVEKAAELLKRLNFSCTIQNDKLMVTPPPTREDIGEGLIGRADVLEEIARLFGYDNIPLTRMADELPPAYVNPMIERENRLKDILVALGLQEIVTYRLTSPEREAKFLGKSAEKYVTLANPISPERSVMRSSLLPCMMETMERNIRLKDRLEFFEVGPVFLPVDGEILPHEEPHLCVAISGKRFEPAWDSHQKENLDFYDLKGIAEAALGDLHVPNISFKPAERSWLHPGKTAEIYAGTELLGVMGEVHPETFGKYDLLSSAMLMMDFNLEKLLPLVDIVYKVHPISQFPSILEDIAVVVDEKTTADEVLEVIKQAGGKMLVGVQLFDIFRGEQLGAGKKSLAYNLVYQSAEKTLTDNDAASIRKKIIHRLEQVLGAKLRS